MKLTRKQLEPLGIHNPHNIMTKTGSRLYISYTGPDYGRGGHGMAHWQVIGNGFATDKNSAWYNHNHITFNIWDRTKKESKLQEALVWVEATYGISEFERDPFGCYQIKGTLDKLKQLLKQQEAQHG